MAITINASTSSGLVQTADTSGVIEVQNNGTTKLTVNSSGVNIGQYNAGTSLITSGSAVGASTAVVDFTSLPSWIKRITVMFDGVSTNGSSQYLIQIGDSGGIETTGYQSVGSNYVGVTTSTAGFVSHNNAAGVTTEGFIEIVKLNGNTWAASGNLSSVGAGQVVSMAGSKTLSATLDRVRITTVNGTDTFDAGTINILYE